MTNDGHARLVDDVHEHVAAYCTTFAAGSAALLDGTATDVARRGPDGYWRYVIDNPFGVS